MSDALAFLRPSPTAVARSPLADRAAADGARLEAVDGWEVAAGFGDVELEQRACRDAVGWADASFLRKVELQGTPERLATIAGSDAVPALGTALRLEGGWWCQLTPSRALVVGGSAAAVALDDGGASVVDVTAAYAALRIVGPLARETFARFCALDLRDAVTPVGAVRPGSVARTPGVVVREGEDRFLMLFGSAYAEYVWAVVSDAGERLGGRPVGIGVLDA